MMQLSNVKKNNKLHLNYEQSKNWKFCFFLLFIVFQIGVCIKIAEKKNVVFCDEIYSYGLANSENYTFLDYTSFCEYSNGNWVTKDYYLNYVLVNKDSDLSFKAPYVNQERDVHPPLYYCLLHFVCFLFAGSYTKWTGIGFNLFILFFLDILFYYIANYLFDRDYTNTVLAVTWWSFSAAGLSNILYIRMYLLLTFLILVYIAIHIHLIKRKRCSIIDFLFLFICVILGGLTHYYFYVYVFFFSVLVGIYLLFTKKIKLFLIYFMDQALAFLLNLLIFPATFTHVFNKNRGTEVLDNLGSSNYRERCFERYCNNINKSFFAGTIKVFVVIGCVFVLYKLFLNIIDYWIGINRTEWDSPFKGDVYRIIISMIMILSTLGFFYVVIGGSGFKSNRYIYPIYPFFSLISIAFFHRIISFFISQKVIRALVKAVLVIVMCIGSIMLYQIDYFYPDYPAIEEKANVIKGYDCLQYFGKDEVDLHRAFDLKILYDESYFFKNNDIPNMQEILNKRKSQDNLVVSFSEKCSEETVDKVMHQIMEVTGHTDYQLVYNYYLQVYELK